MTTNSNELKRWVDKFQRKLDSIPLTRGDREDLEELATIIVNLAMKQMLQPGQTAETPLKKRNGG